MKIGMRTFKTAIGATIAILLAQWLGLEYAVSAGVITILSIQNTKKSSLLLAVQRIYSTVLALSISAIFFLITGFNAFSFGLFLLVFIPIAVKLKVADGILVSSVLVTHILAQKSLSLYWFGNEMLLMMIGAGLGILLNLYMPKLEVNLKNEQLKIEAIMRQILFSMSQGLKNQSAYLDNDRRFTELKTALSKMQKNASQNHDNHFFGSSHYYVQYVDMRLVQYRILTQMKRHLIAFEVSNEQSMALASLTEKTALELAEDNSAASLIEAITKMVRDFRKTELPKTREEFENRAVLFQFMNDFRYLLEVKHDFHMEFGESGNKEKYES
ncbi:aromatic acid exporter family protein [Listeria sp. PSOL-1]|uniref:aromatic acid exporter family protein n=1 Tax=Listeria sp. PSOL-1 TaxID=1844999 RepID=UPI0013D053D8|nr:aromatic acid exporter family protein [Listeria sp. PSOL-1]